MDTERSGIEVGQARGAGMTDPRQAAIYEAREIWEDSATIDDMFVAITNALLAARVEGMREAANFVGTMAERPYDTDPEFSAVIHVESVLRARADELEAMAKEIER